MSIKSAFESEGIDFSQVMNPPEPWDGRALIKMANCGIVVLFVRRKHF